MDIVCEDDASTFAFNDLSTILFHPMSDIMLTQGFLFGCERNVYFLQRKHSIVDLGNWFTNYNKHRETIGLGGTPSKWNNLVQHTGEAIWIWEV
jgi:hypothetical protein